VKTREATRCAVALAFSVAFGACGDATVDATDAAVDAGPIDAGPEPFPWWIRRDAGTDAATPRDAGRWFIPDDDAGADDDAGWDGIADVTYAGGNGTSCDEAVIILGAGSELEGVFAEYVWLDEHYPGYDVLGQALSFCGDDRVDILHIRTRGGTERDIYFDIDDFFGK